MALKVNPGFTGYALIGGSNKIRFQSASITAKQSVEIPDMIMGHWDHNAYYFGPVEISGSIEGPVTERFVGDIDSIWTWGTNRSGSCGELAKKDVALYYFCDAGFEDAYGINGRVFGDMQVNNIGFSCSAGDVAKFTLDVMGATAPVDSLSAAPAVHTVEERIMTWDQVGVKMNTQGFGATLPVEVKYSSFDFTISNNLEVVYGIGQDSLYPFEIVPGLRKITGSLSAFNIPSVLGADHWADYTASSQGEIEFNIGAQTFAFKVQFHRVEPAFSVGPIMSTIAFTGAGNQTTLDT